MRGVDPKLYSRYILSLLDCEEPEEDPETRGPPQGLLGGDRQKLEAVKCLQSACAFPYEVDVLVDELCYRLQRLNRDQEAVVPPEPPSPDTAYLSAFPPLEAPARRLEAPEEDADDDSASLASEGSDILNLVNQILLSFNSELSEGMLPEPEEAPDHENLQLSASARMWAADPLWENKVEEEAEEEELTPYCDDEAGGFSDYDFDEGHEEVEEATTAAACVPEKKKRVHWGPVAVPEEELAQRMQEWTPLDVVRHELWSRAPRPPVVPSEVPRGQRACSFLLRGHCKKDNCEFAHDLAQVTCKFWSSGECFKGPTCPFLHGYAES